ncbi:hypothetical protein C8R47DRAFT_1078087 [Mycena vitilis]|nr:hypothetical protein C8R47DRAFT_1078087 [Mycena vitilis]
MSGTATASKHLGVSDGPGRELKATVAVSLLSTRTTELSGTFNATASHLDRSLTGIYAVPLLGTHQWVLHVALWSLLSSTGVLNPSRKITSGALVITRQRERTITHTSSICTDVTSIQSCGILETLSSWAACLRRKLILCDKIELSVGVGTSIIMIASTLTAGHQFHAGGDSEHLYWISVLCVWRAETESALEAVNQQHSELCGTTSADPEDLDEDELAAVLDWDASLSDDATAAEDPYADQFEKERRRERNHLLEQFFAFRKAALLHGDDTRAHFVDYMERLVIHAICERSGMRALLHDDIDDVEAFLVQDIITLEELKQIYVAVHTTPPRMVLNAIVDAFRDPQEPHDIVLGRRIYRQETGGEICFTAWDLFEDVMPCRHCALQGCHRLEEWTKIDRLATLSLRFLNWQPGNLESFSRADTLFHLSGVFAERTWERYRSKPFFSKRHGKQYVQIEKSAGLYLKFPLANTDTYHRFLHTLQSLKDVFSVLSWAPDFMEDSGTLIPRARTQLCASRIRVAKTEEDLPYAQWQESETIHEREAHVLHDASRDPLVLHMVVLDRTGAALEGLKHNLALAFLFAEQVDVQTPRAFVAAEMRKLLDAGAAPDFGFSEAGLMGVAAGAIETLSDADLVTRWGNKKRKRKQQAAAQCWKKWKGKLDRMACSKDFFYLGTEEGETHIREKLGKTISPTDGAVVKYDEVFQRALDRSQAVEKMVPPRKIPMDWDGEILYPEEIIDIFSFTRDDFSEEETGAKIVEVQNEFLNRRIKLIGFLSFVARGKQEGCERSALVDRQQGLLGAARDWEAWIWGLFFPPLKARLARPKQTVAFTAVEHADLAEPVMSELNFSSQCGKRIHDRNTIVLRVLRISIPHSQRAALTYNVIALLFGQLSVQNRFGGTASGGVFTLSQDSSFVKRTAGSQTALAACAQLG